MQSRPLTLAAATVLALASLYASPAAAVDVLRDRISHGAANCQSALPVFDGLIRKRPKAVANEGTTPAFVTCDFESTPNRMDRVTAVGMYFISRNAAEVSVSCTLVDGAGDSAHSPAIVKTLNLAPGSGLSEMSWSTADNGGVNFSFVATSCKLLPGVEIAATQIVVLEDIGQ